jgi:ArsR family transcriptional regulator, arsenate/arsenite/antimonite-responsive transcriptional repressor
MKEPSISILKALADETRLDIIRRLQKSNEASCTEISTCSRLSQPAMSHHFNKLVEAGVLKESKHGTEKFYELDIKQLDSHGIDINKLLKQA